MIVILEPNIDKNGEPYQRLLAHLAALPNIQVRTHEEHGIQQTLTELYLVGDTAALTLDNIAALPGVARAVRVSREYRILGRYKDDHCPTAFDYNGVRFGQDTLHVFAGLCAVDTREHVEAMLCALRDHG